MRSLKLQETSIKFILSGV